jgi:endonuclease/exonuclease/phosphatase family metal-dependent hydrolase
MKTRLLAALSAIVIGIGLVAVPLSPAEATGKPGSPLTVMTRNLYLGADINRPVLAALAAQQAGGSQLDILVALANATHQTRAIVDQTNFNVRARLLAKEFKKNLPDLVGLQEVALWRSGPMELDKVGVPNATTVDYDFLAILLKALREKGLHYKAVQVGNRADVESPSFAGASPTPDGRDIRLTMRDVILKRVGSDVKILDHHERTYDAGIDITIANQKLDFTRGYQWVNAERGDQRFRFINTHLEAFSSDVAYAEAQQMLAGPGDYRGTTIIVCDCNSDPLNQSVKTAQGDSLPHSEPYWLVTGQNDFNDTWLQWRPARFGWTSGLTETVDDPDASNFDHRIDMVFARTGSGAPLKVVRGTVTGDEVADRDPATGLWPSDHAGVVMRLRGLGRS